MTECSRQVLISVCLSREAHAPSSFGFSFSSSIWRIGNASLPADLLQIVKVSSLVWYVSCKFNYVVTVAASAAYYHFIQLTILLTVGSVAAAIYWFWAVWSGRMCMPGMMNFRESCTFLSYFTVIRGWGVHINYMIFLVAPPFAWHFSKGKFALTQNTDLDSYQLVDIYLLQRFLPLCDFSLESIWLMVYHEFYVINDIYKFCINNFDVSAWA